MTLDDPRALERVDRHNTRDVLAGFPAQCRRARELPVPDLRARERPRAVIVAGMGGSAASGDLAAACAADRVDVPILVHRGYGLPAVAGPQTLVLASSYSGETAEVLSSVGTALERRVPLVAITSGGALGAIAASRGLPRVTLPGGLMPRMALGYLLLPTLAVLAGAGVAVATEGEVDEALDVLDAVGAELGPDRPAAANQAKRLALVVGDRLPAIYGGPVTAALAYRWKTDLEENAKTLALAGALPEMNHNEIEAWRRPGAAGVHAILLRDAGEPTEIARRFDILQALIGPAAGGVSEAWSRGRGRLARLLSLVCLGQWVSYYLAVLRETDPWAVPMLEEMKRRLAAEPDAAARDLEGPRRAVLE